VSPAWRIARVCLTTAEPEKTSAFLREALGFEDVGTEERAGEGFARLMGIEGARARVVLLRLGRQEVELVAFARPGRPYPPGNSTASDRWFQHMAIVVSDMRAAYARLSARPGWTPISTAGPQRLPESSGGVTAFKFRGPEGHPLELLAFPASRTPAAWQERRPADPCLGIDHSAIVVADTAASVAFYARFGFAVSERSLNHGVEQERLDGVPGARVEVTALRQEAADGPPHLELLCYLPPSAGRPAPPETRSDDVAATRLVLRARDAAVFDEVLEARGAPAPSGFPVPLRGGPRTALLRDPDGHGLSLLG
jgi:catechol 2,3-dioxygenase-like lactoylglutathione lyase family enzyme